MHLDSNGDMVYSQARIAQVASSSMRKTSQSTKTGSLAIIRSSFNNPQHLQMNHICQKKLSPEISSTLFPLQDIKCMPVISDQDMNAMLAEVILIIKLASENRSPNSHTCQRNLLPFSKFSVPQESRLHSNEFNLNSALHELYT